MNQDNLEKRIAEYVIEYKEAHYRLAFSYVKNKEDALDVIQESICKAFVAAETLKDPNSIKTWYYRILVNTSLDLLRQRKKEILTGEEFLLNLNIAKNDNYENFDLMESLDNLPDIYRSIIILRYFEDLKLQDIADILNENLSTVKTRLYTGLERLRIVLNDHEKQEVIL